MIAANRVSELPLRAVVKGSTIRPCGNCGKSVWVSPSSQRVLAEDPHAVAYCLIQCFPIKTMEARANPEFEGQEYGVAPGWEEEVREAGLGDNEVTDIKAFLIELNEGGRDEG